MTQAVVLDDLSVSFQGHTVLHGVSATFAARRISVIVGRSGSGKTTLLRAMNRLNEEFPGCRTTGRVRVDVGQGLCDVYEGSGLPSGTNNGAGGGAESGAASRGLLGFGHSSMGLSGMELTTLRQRVGMLFQTPNCFPVSAYRNIAMPLALVSGAEQVEIPGRVRAALEAVGLWEELKDRMDIPAARLSGGQQQRLCLARLLALQPAVLLLDEPTASLDVHAAREIEELLRQLARQYTIIMVSHGLSQARRMAHSLLVCERGRISATYADPASLSDAVLGQVLDSSA